MQQFSNKIKDFVLWFVRSASPVNGIGGVTGFIIGFSVRRLAGGIKGSS